MQLYTNFTEPYIKLRSLFVVIGKTEMSNNMVSYTTAKQVFVNKTVCSSGDFLPAVDKQYHRGFYFRFLPSIDIVHRVIKQYEVCLCDKSAEGRKSNASVRTEAVVGAGLEAVTGCARNRERR
jgi:hypothetical protein